MRNNVINYTQLNTTNNEIFVAKYLITIYIYNKLLHRAMARRNRGRGSSRPLRKKY